MNAKEIGEIRRRIRRDRANMTAIYGCYVKEDGKIISTFRSSLGTMPENEADKYMKLFKKTLSGTQGKTLNDIIFRTKQVADKEARHDLLMTLCQNGLDDEDRRNELYRAIIASVKMETNYLILLGHDTYDIPFKTKDDVKHADSSEETFTYILCAVCPVKETTSNLHYVHDESVFHDGGMIQAVNKPEMGFLFPAFDDRSTNIYGALFYNKDTSDDRQEFIDAVFGASSPSAADQQKKTFDAILSSNLGEECSIDVIQALHDKAVEMMQMHKESKNPEILTVDRNTVESILNGASPEKINDFGDAFDEAFGMNANIPLANIVDTKHYVVKTQDAVIKVAADQSGAVEVRKIGGLTYVCILAEGEIEVNGIQLAPNTSV